MAHPITGRNPTSVTNQPQLPLTMTATDASAPAVSSYCGDFFKSFITFFSHSYADFRMFWRGYVSMGHGTTSEDITRRINEINRFSTFIQNCGYNRTQVIVEANRLSQASRDLSFYVDMDYLNQFQAERNPDSIEEMRREIVRECAVAVSFQETLTRVNTFYRLFSGNFTIRIPEYDPDRFETPPSPWGPETNVEREPTVPLLPPVEIPGDEPIIDEPAPTAEVLAARKTAALVRLGQIEAMGDARNRQFEPNPVILNFNLDAILERYNGNQAPSRLCELLEWAEVDNMKRATFGMAVRGYDHGGGGQQGVVKNLLSKMHSYFTQRMAQVTGTPAEDDLKEQFKGIVDRIIDANNNCIDQMLSQLQGMMLDVVADGFASTRGGRQLERIQFRTGHELCKYRSNLLRQILVRQNPQEGHMADLEREVMRRLASSLGMQGRIFNAGARFAHMVHDVNGKANRAIATFRQEYKPLEYLANQLRVPHGLTRKLRADILQWADQHYGLGDEDADNTTPTDMNRRLSANFDEGITGPFADGGEWTPSAAYFMLEAANLSQPVV